MASSYGSDSDLTEDLDPAADLALLDRATASVAIDQMLDFGPWWYAPFLATTVGAATMIGESDSTAWNMIFVVAALVSGVAVAAHDTGRRRVRQRLTARGSAIPVLIGVALGFFGVIAAWGTALSVVGYARFVPGYATLAWIATTVGLLGIRFVLISLRARRRALT